MLLPLVNNSQTPMAGQRAAAILQTLLRARGVENLQEPPPEAVDGPRGRLPEISDRRRLARAVAWARKHGFRYGVTGSVEEWRYRGLDGRPAAGATVMVLDLASGKVLFSASGAMSGWGRDTVSGIAQKLLRDLVEGMELTP